MSVKDSILKTPGVEFSVSTGAHHPDVIRNLEIIFVVTAHVYNIVLRWTSYTYKEIRIELKRSDVPLTITNCPVSSGIFFEWQQSGRSNWETKNTTRYGQEWRKNGSACGYRSLDHEIVGKESEIWDWLKGPFA